MPKSWKLNKIRLVPGGRTESWPSRDRKAPSCGGSRLGGAHGPRHQRAPGAAQTPWLAQARLPQDALCPPGHKEQMGLLSLPTAISSCKRKEQNRKCLRQSAPWVDERKQRVRLHPSTRPVLSGQRPGPRPCCCQPYVAEGVRPVSGGVDVAWRG